MLLEFSVKNFYSFKEKVTFSMLANKSEVLKDNYVTTDKFRILKSAAIYGANASGKSNLFKVLSTVVEMLKKSNSISYYEELPIEPFRLNELSKESPSEFEIRFIVDNIQYVYGFTATSRYIEEEYLYYYPNGKETKIFYRKNRDKYYFTARESKNLNPIALKTAENKFFLATATNWNYEKTRPVYEFLTEHLMVCKNIDNLELEALKKYYSDESGKLKEFALDFLKKADINIIDYKIYQIDIFANSSTSNKHYLYKARFKHKGVSEDLFLNLDDESLGTEIIFYLIPFIFDAINSSGVVVIDELDRSLHPYLVEYVVSLFNGFSNKSNSQLIFNTHDTNLLNLNILRKDQIWFTEKNDENASSDLYSLNDFTIRKNENIEKGYLLGRYGAIPFIIRDIDLWDIDE